MFVLDEAHCIHDQGKTFRPKYREVDRLKTIFNKPTLALTATADEATKEDILQVANMREAFIQQLSSYRRNLFLEARRVSKSARMDALVKQAGPDQGSGIVYAQRRDDTEMIAKHLCDQGIKAAAYHAKIAPEFKRSSQAAFMSGELQVIVATTAFGMGINKRDTRWVIHMNPPGSLSEYIQQVGRAGRDGHSARCLLMYSEWELGAMVKKAMNREDSDMRKVEIGWAHKMIAFLQSKDCRHQFICSSYGEELPECRTDGGGGHCDNCSNNK
jgi:ATP-dependent DNA helicase RecQ